VVRGAYGRVTVPGFRSAAYVADSRYAFSSTPQSFADSIRLWNRAATSVPRLEREP
jgi:hypothetical protein